MGCSTSRSVSLPLGDGAESLIRVKQKFTRNKSCAPVRSTSERDMSTSCKPMLHYDYHVVALTSSTYGIMKLDSGSVKIIPVLRDDQKSSGTEEKIKSRREPHDEEAPTETINTWELMEGLDDIVTPRSDSPLQDNSSLFDPDILASFASSVGTGRNTDQSSSSESDSSGCCSTSAVSLISKADAADQDVTSDQNWTRMGMTALQDQKNFCKVSFAKITPIDAADFPETNISNQPVRSVNIIPSAISGLEAAAYERKCPPGGDERVVLYSTSLRGIRKTFQDCNKVRTILQTYVLWIDERDVSMHVEFRKELKDLLLQHEPLTGSTALQVPRVFIMGYYIGGVEEVVELHETEKLGFAHGPAAESCNNHYYHCNGCGGVRFVPCPNCNGSCKIISAENSSYSNNNKIIRCPDCNENGLIRCPICL
ncbi:unnamed protein product [Sphagnum tenellum]